MRAVVCREHGGPDSLVVDEIPDPDPAPGHVVVDVAYAAVNFPDVLIVANRYQIRVATPFVPGSEFAGVVSAVGEGVTSPRIGDRVFGSTLTGAFAERVSVPATSLTAVPAGVSLRSAAGFWVTHATAYHSLRSVAGVRPGERVLVLGAGGGVGLAAVATAVLLGAEVVAAASTRAKLEAGRQHGARHLVDYGTTDLRDGLRAVAPDGVDVVVDPVGGQLAEQALRALRWRGRFVTVGFASGEIPRIPLNLVLLKGCVVKGFEIGSFGLHEPELVARDRVELLDMLGSGRIDPHVSAVHPLDDVVTGLTRVGGRASVGKVLIEVAGEPVTDR